MISWKRKRGIGFLFVVVALTAAQACGGKGTRLSVFQPAQSSHFRRGDTIHFASELNSDADPGVTPPDAWRWVSDRDGEIGRGPRVDAASLSIGEHHVTVTVHHKLGVSQAGVTIFVDSAHTRN